MNNSREQRGHEDSPRSRKAAYSRSRILIGLTLGGALLLIVTLTILAQAAPHPHRLAILAGGGLASGLVVVAARMMQTEIRRRYWAENWLRELNASLELRVAERIAELQATNLALQQKIAEHARIETRLTASLKESADLRTALDEHAIVAITDRRGRITYVNDKFCAISGYSRAELLGQDHRIINSGHHSREFFRQLWVTIAHGEVWKGEVKNRAKDGHYYWMDTTILPLLNADQKPDQYVTIRTDVSELKQAQEEMQRLNASLEERVATRTRQLEAANESLRFEINERKRAEQAVTASLAEKETLLKEIHHRVKNNMQVISSILNLQSGYVEDVRFRKMFQECQNRVRSMALVHEKLYRAHNLATIDFGEHLRDLAGMLVRSYATGLDHIRLETEIETHAVHIDVAIPVSLILNELVSNAQKHAFANSRPGTLKVGLRTADDQRLCLSVADDGPGLPPDFDVAESRSLGWKMVRSLARQIRGEVVIRQQAGTNFSVLFPKSPPSNPPTRYEERPHTHC